MTAFYNEIDPHAAVWLRNLISAGHIAPGIVDERPIQEIEAWELTGYTQCHFFAGIGIWSLALRRAGWPDSRPIWTGSCPCQPFSAAGKKKGIKDERHLWPFWSKLIEQCKPPIVIGEQVASKDGLGWLDLVSSEMEAASYSFGACDLCAAGFGGAHLRQRLYFVGMAYCCEQSGEWNAGEILAAQARQHGERIAVDGSINLGHQYGSATIGMAESNVCGQSGSGKIRRSGDPETDKNWQECRIVDDGRKLPNGGMEHSNLPGQYERASGGKQSLRHVSNGTDEKSDSSDQREIASRWLDVDWLLCRNPAGEPSWRPVEPGTFPLDNAVAGRMGFLRAYGNALDAETATNFCEVVREICDDLRSVREFDL